MALGGGIVTAPTTAEHAPGTRARFIRHRSGCPGGALTWKRATHGDMKARCDSCGRWGFPPTDAETPMPEPEPVALVVDAGYRCRAHYAVVSFRGTGCRRCEAEYRESKQGRKRKRTTTEEL